MARLLPQLVIAAWLVVLAAIPAQAQYLDPGAGSVAVQAIIAVAVGLATVLKLYWSRIKGLFRRRSNTPEP